MKVLDVASLQAGIAETMADIEIKQTQIEAVQRAVRDFHSLDGALEGQAGDAIRDFYKDTHEPFLIHLHQTLTNYKQALKATSEAIHSFESDSDGYVSQAFLLNDVKEGYDQVGKTAKTFADEVNHIISGVQDIVSIKPIDETEVMDSVTKGKEQVESINQAFIAVDEEGASGLEETQDELKTMQTFLSDMSTKFVDSASISSYSVESTRDMSALHTIKEEVYGENLTVSDANDKLDNMSMSEIDTMHKKKLERLNPNPQDQEILNDLLNEHKHGNISRETYLSLIQEYSANKRFSEKTYGDLKVLGITVLTTNNHGIAAGIDHNTKVGVAGVDKLACGFSTVLKGGTYAVGSTYGMYDDLANNNKTVGEAIAHNGASLAIGIGTATVMSAFGAPIVAGLAVGAGLGLLFEIGYNRNWFELQTGLDKVGQGLTWTANKIKDGVNWTKDKAGDAIQVTKDKAGEAVHKTGQVLDNVTNKAKDVGETVGHAVSSHMSKVNPMKWAW